MARPNLTTTSRVLARVLGLEPEALRQHFHPAEEKQLSQILDIRQSFLHGVSVEDDAGYLRWRYSWHAVAPGSDWDENRIWVFETDGDVLGFIGVEVVPLSLKGRTVTCLKLMDLAVKPTLDGKGLGVWMNLALLESGFPVVTLGSNRNSLGMISRLFHRMPDRKVYKTLFKSEPYFLARLGDNLAARLVAVFYDLGAALSLGVRAASAGRGLSLEHFDHFDRAREAAANSDDTREVRVIKDADYLNWRLTAIPNDRCELFAIAHDGVFVGYIALSARNNGRWREAYIQDWGMLPDARAERWFVKALLLLQQRLFREGYSNLSGLGYDRHSDTLLRRAGMRRRLDNSKTFAVYCTDESIMKELSDADAWFLTGSDADDF